MRIETKTRVEDSETAASHRLATERVIAEMRNSTNDTLTLDAMSEIAHLSPYHFARVFRRVTGVPPAEFLSALRLEKAKELLLTTDLSASEVCFEVGYNSLGTFTTRFTQLVGISPGRMRCLPEVLYETLGHVTEESRPPPPLRQSPGVAFRVRGPDLDGKWIFAGLFPGAIPQRRPVAGILLDAPGTYQLPATPDGYYHLMAAALPLTENPLDSLLPGSVLRVGRSQTILLMRKGRVTQTADVEMRPARATDPPVLLALPALLPELLSPGAP